MKTTVLQVTMPKDLLSMLSHSRSGAEEAIREFSVLGLYLERRISAGKAAELLDVRKREFVRLLARKGIPYFDYTDEELSEEFGAADEHEREGIPA